MNQMFNRFAIAALSVSVSFGAMAADYYVASDGAYDGAPDGATVCTTIDEAINAATSASDNIYVEAGTYSTTTQWGPNLQARLIGMGATRDEVVIQSAGTYRTLRMAANSWLENVTIVGEGTWQADKGGAIEMNGGTLINCVVRDGTAKANGNTSGGNLYVNSDAALVTDCEIYGGSATNRGGNVYLDKGLVRNCTIYNGTCVNNIGGNIYQYGGTVSNCVIYGGTAKNDGGNVRMNGAGSMVDCVISNGAVQVNDKKGANVYMDSTAKMSRCRLVGGIDTYDNNGGSLCVYSSSAVVEDCLVEASECGGVLLGSAGYIYNCTVVNNDKYGFWSWNKTQHLFNVVVYGNDSEWNGELPTNASAEIAGCASSSSARIVTDGDFGVTVVTDADFSDYANGNYRPASGSALIDAGTADPRGAAASTTDLDGNLRTSGTIDIGCYEAQKAEMIVHIDGATYSQVFAPSTVTFTHSSDNSASPENVVFTYDFGDGSATESTSELTISHVYSSPGVYTVHIAATNACDEEYAEMTYDGYARIASSTIYVTPNNGAGVFPYDTPATGHGNLKTAVQSALDGYTLLLGEGVHETVDQVSFSKAITIRGLGVTPDAVVVSNTVAEANTYYHRVLEMNNANGRIENITIANGCVKNQFGGNLRLVTGIVSNCVIRGGLAVADNGNAGGAGVELAGAGTITHCIISNNTVQGSSNSGSYAGGAIAVQYNAKNGRVSNCLVAHNRYVTSGDTKAGAAGIRFCGSNDNTQIENNTIVANVVEGSLADDSAGVYCTTWYGRLRNNIIVGNYETGKDTYTSVKMDTEHGTYVNNLDDATAFSVFRNFAKGDFSLKPSSAACNAGTTSGLTLLPAVDLAGNPRVFGKGIDIGCYECQRKLGFSIIFK
ncbi:MAG: PKD domain-containing protein [Kiritimatiellae bacterium]|nr:PKD domain-containing protein [Kiritimatiellia bacterium]